MLLNMAPLFKLYPFKYRDPLSGIWTKARYKARLEDIRARYAEWMIDGEPEIRGHIPSVGFNPYTASQAVRGARRADITTNIEMQPQRRKPSGIDRVEAFLVASFLRRHVTYCARRGLRGYAGRGRTPRRGPMCRTCYGHPTLVKFRNAADECRKDYDEAKRMERTPGPSA
jgi:hypothetical protein